MSAQSARRPAFALSVASLAVAALVFWNAFQLSRDSFWIAMAAGGVVLSAAAFAVRGRDLGGVLGRASTGQVLVGVGAAIVLYAVFGVGNIVVRIVLGFAAPDIASIYGLGALFPGWLIALLLLFVIGPAEEFYWRGLVQTSAAERFGPIGGYAFALAAYTAVHLLAGNATIVLAAFVAGAFFGAVYVWLGRLWPLVVAHALFDVLVFSIRPFA